MNPSRLYSAIASIAAATTIPSDQQWAQYVKEEVIKSSSLFFPTTLAQLIAEYSGSDVYEELTHIVMDPDNRDKIFMYRSDGNATFFIASIDQGLPQMHSIVLQNSKFIAYHDIIFAKVPDYALQSIACKTGLPYNQIVIFIKGISKNALWQHDEKVSGIQQNALSYLQHLLSSYRYTLVSKQSKAYIKGTQKSTVLFPFNITLHEWGHSIENFYKQIKRALQAPLLGSLSPTYFASMNYFIQAYEYEGQGKSLIALCKQASRKQGIVAQSKDLEH